MSDEGEKYLHAYLTRQKTNGIWSETPGQFHNKIRPVISRCFGVVFCLDFFFSLVNHLEVLGFLKQEEEKIRSHHKHCLLTIAFYYVKQHSSYCRNYFCVVKEMLGM